MILSLALLLLTAPQDTLRQRHLLPNGSVLYVEQMAREGAVSVQLFASTRGIAERPDAHGRRHLLEHLMAKGDGTLDERLEAQGVFLTAATYRDAMQFSLLCPPDKLSVALAVVRDLLKPFATTPEAIAREARILRQEEASLPAETRLSVAAWRSAYGNLGLDPSGSDASIAATTPKQLADLHAALFGADRLALTITGPIHLDQAVLAGRTALRAAGPPVKEVAQVRADGNPGLAKSDLQGEAIAAIVPSVRDPRTTWALAAALVIAARVGEAFVIYTPSAGNGLVIVGRTDEGLELASTVQSLTPGDRVGSLALAKQLVRSWVDRSLESASSRGSARGLLLCQGASLRPEIVLENLEAMRAADLEEGFAMLGRERAVTVQGGGR